MRAGRGWLNGRRPAVQWATLASLSLVFVVVALVLNLVLWRMFVRPVTRMSALADRVSLGEIDAPEFTVKSKDEIGTLAASLTRMRVSLVQAFKMLEG